MKYRLLSVGIILGIVMTFSACGSTAQGVNSQGKNSLDKVKSTQKTAQQPEDEIANLLGKTLIPDEERDYYQNYFTKKYDNVRRDDISAWKDSDGNWCYPKGYEIQWKPSNDELMASQQFPQELLEDMSTGELYQFIRKAHGFWSQSAFDNYAQMLSYYYCRYNFIAELMRREDCAEVIHTYYEKTSEDDKKQYSKTASRQFSDDKKLEKQEQFQILEGLEWLFQYKNGKSVPDDLAFGMQLISASK